MRITIRMVICVDMHNNICYVIGILSSYMTGTRNYHAGHMDRWDILV